MTKEETGRDIGKGMLRNKQQNGRDKLYLAT